MKGSTKAAKPKVIPIWSGYDLHPGQQKIFNSEARFRVVSCGRRFGKTTLAETELAITAGQGYPCAYFAPDYKRTEEVWRDMKALLAPMTLRKDETMHRLELMTGGVIEFWTLADERAGASRHYKKVVLDEAAHSPNLEEVWLAAIRPSLMDLEGTALFLSTPKGHNYFWHLFRLGEDDLEPEWKEFKMPSSANPYLRPHEIESARRSTPENMFKEEYLAEFMSDSGAVFRKIRDAYEDVKAQTAPIPGHSYIFGVDLAKSNDFSVFAVYDSTANALAYIDRATHVDYSLQLERLISLYQRFKPNGIVIESNAHVDFVERCEKANLPVIPFRTGLATKALVIEHMAAAFDNGQISIYEDPVLIGELEGYEMERLASGMFRYNAPRGSHDDTVIALALAYYGATYGVSDWKAEIVDGLESWRSVDNLPMLPAPTISLGRDTSYDIVDWPILPLLD